MEVADVVVVDEHVDEAAQRAVVEEPLGEPGMALSSSAMTSVSVPGATSSGRVPPDSGRMVVGIRTVTAMSRNLTVQVRNPAERPVGEFMTDGHGTPTAWLRSAMRVLAALDKFRGTASAAEATGAVAAACWELGVDCDEAPMSDGGEGMLDVFGGGNRTSVVTGPLGRPVEAAWRHRRPHGGRSRWPGRAASRWPAAPSGNDPLAATTAGTGELIARAIEQGARTVLVGLGGSATTDGGLGAIEALGSPARLGAVDLQVACDVRTRFVDAAAVFAPQKGATPAQVRLLTARLRAARRPLRAPSTASTSATSTAPAPPAGWPAGCSPSAPGCVPGFDLVAEHVDLDERLAAADVVVTGEGYLDAQSLDGKVVGGVCEPRRRAGVPVVVIVGDADPGRPATTVDSRYGGRRLAGRAVRRAASVQRAALVHRAGAVRQALATTGLSQPAVVVVAPPAGVGAWTLGAAPPQVVERFAGDVVAHHHEHGRRRRCCRLRPGSSRASAPRRGRPDRGPRTGRPPGSPAGVATKYTTLSSSGSVAGVARRLGGHRVAELLEAVLSVLRLATCGAGVGDDDGRSSVTRAGALVAGAAVVAVVAPEAAVVVAPAAVVGRATDVSKPPASLSSIERKMRKPTATAINASTIVSGEPTGDPESPTRVDERPRSALAPTPPGSVGSLMIYLPVAHSRRSRTAVLLSG